MFCHAVKLHFKIVFDISSQSLRNLLPNEKARHFISSRCDEEDDGYALETQQALASLEGPIPFCVNQSG
jgi:hypothetical protein